MDGAGREKERKKEKEGGGGGGDEKRGEGEVRYRIKHIISYWCRIIYIHISSWIKKYIIIIITTTTTTTNTTTTTTTTANLQNTSGNSECFTIERKAYNAQKVEVSLIIQINGVKVYKTYENRQTFSYKPVSGEVWSVQYPVIVKFVGSAVYYVTIFFSFKSILHILHKGI